jgi:hypothetical protein
VECDLLRFFGTDLLDAYAEPPRLSLRRLAVLVRGLPADSATVRALEPSMQWGSNEYLLAHILDVLRVGNWLVVESNKRRGARNPYPQPVPRPGDVEEHTPQAMTGHELTEWLGKVG